MCSNNRVALAAIIVTFIVVSSLMTGCATQTLDFSRMTQGDPLKREKLTHFKESGHSVYMLLDLIEVSPVTVDQLIARANPDNRPVINLSVTSSEGGWATLLNILNGGVIDRGVIVSLNTITVEGDIIQP